MRKLALLFAIALLTAACGDGTETSQSDTNPAVAAPTTTPATAAPTEDAANDHADESHDEEESGDQTTDAGSGVEDVDAHSDDDHEEEGDGHADDGNNEDHADGGNDEGTANAADRTVQVAMTEFAFEPEEFEAMAGETVEFIVTNLGVVEHEFRLSNAHRIEEHLASGHADHDDGGGHHEDGDVVLHVEPGDTGSVTVTFGEDTSLYTEVACLIPGHYEAGMKAPMQMSG